MGRFWYIPSWWSEPIRKLPTSFNARAETVLEKAFFRGARPCVVPTSGWREFPGPRGKKRAYHFYQPAQNDQHSPLEAGFFGFAAICSSWSAPESSARCQTFSLLTTEPNDIVRPFHHRMPVLVPKELQASWCNAETVDAHLLQQCIDYTSGAPLAHYECSTYGNSTKNEGPRCLLPAGKQFSLFAPRANNARKL